ncbi:hypothetical protein [Tabrizicola sp.]|uniref:hypothetical protein n=1 Tax=Tabrizicola sp. TaxID=2005166 RepID=UPI001A5E7A9D|nr:hypothetical protein [Tabrizicola sp.]MBL9074747.1 hypothetical protein [Tabrizicola sp.]
MSRTFLPAAGATVAALMLAACTPSTPDSGAGVGFQDYNSYIRGASPAPAGAPVTVVPPGGGFDPAAAAAAIDRSQGVAPVTAAPVVAPTPTATPLPTSTPTDSSARPRGGAPAGIKEESGEVASHTGISDEQDFDAVSSRETIESDKERIEKNRAEYVVVQPKDLPQRPGDTGPNIVEFALATTHAPGVQMYKRSGMSLRSADSSCAKYSSPDQAQQDFLAKGGPDRDRMGIDPDGDGFACSWDPRPFRTALQ